MTETLAIEVQVGLAARAVLGPTAARITGGRSAGRLGPLPADAEQSMPDGVTT
jgi:hypothetical protein